MGEFVNLEIDHNSGVATVRIDRPPINAISKQLTAELHESVSALAGDESVGAVVVWGLSLIHI